MLPKVMTEDLAYLVGVIVGDGWVTSDGGLVGIVSGDEEYLRFVISSLFKKLFGCDVHIRRDPRKNHTYFLETHSKIINAFLVHVFGFKRGKKVPKIPTVFKNYPRNILMEFIAGFFDTDGSVNKSSCTIKFTQKSREILEQIKGELASLEIRSSINYDKRWDGWDLRLSTKDRKKFFTFIKPRTKKKKAMAKNVLLGRWSSLEKDAGLRCA